MGLGLTVKRLQMKHHRAATDALRPIGVTLVQWDALRHLHENPGASQHDLAVLTFQTDQAFGTLASRLEARGLINRGAGTGRAIRLELTEEGERVFAAGERVTEKVVRASFSPLNADEQTVLGGMLDAASQQMRASTLSLRLSPSLSHIRDRHHPVAFARVRVIACSLGESRSEPPHWVFALHNAPAPQSGLSCVVRIMGKTVGGPMVARLYFHEPESTRAPGEG